jgi:hypothetical protein
LGLQMQPIPDKTDLPRWHDLMYSTVKLALKKKLRWHSKYKYTGEEHCGRAQSQDTGENRDTGTRISSQAQLETISIDVVADELSGRISIRKAKNGLLGRGGDMI